MDIRFEINGVFVDIEVMENGKVALWNCSAIDRPRGDNAKWYPLCEVQGTGFNHNDHHGNKHTLTSPASELLYERHSLVRNELGDVFELVQKSDAVRVVTRWQFYDKTSVMSCETEVENIGEGDFFLEYISSFALTGLGFGSDARLGDYKVWLPHNTWYGECQWKTYTLGELGYDAVNDFSMKRIALSNVGTWACSEHLPMGSFTQPNHAVTWEIETSASWCWEISDLGGQLYLRLSGPSWTEHQFIKRMKPSERFTSVPCAIALASDFEKSIGEMTKYRRLTRRPNDDNARPSVIFNDYMNCLWGDPTTEKEYPLIGAAAVAGCKYYCVDCGWYDDGPWWDGVGEWLPAKSRFPEGLPVLLNYIREKGMIPGLWLEIEVMGINCPLAKTLPDDWFFMIEGRRVIDESRYQLDFRNADVERYADSVIDRLVREYGVGYIKMDYNINAGVGTQHMSDSAGEGLLSHTRAYLAWLDKVFARYPSLVIENCSSGGMRMEHSHLRRHSIQSVTDQVDYIKMAAIACNCMTACTPEQAAIWSYPMTDGDEEETIFNMVNAMLLRIHQSGHLANLAPARLALVQEGIACHLSIIDRIKDGLPFWPLGLASFQDEWLCAGVNCQSEAFLAVWHTKAELSEKTIKLPGVANVECVFPKRSATQPEIAFSDDNLTIRLNGVCARLFKLKWIEYIA